MESRRKGESTLLDWERRAGEKERGCTLKGYAKFREKRVKRLQDASTLHLDRVAMVSTITRRIDPRDRVGFLGMQSVQSPRAPH